MYFSEKLYTKVLFSLVLIISKIIYSKEFISYRNEKKIKLNETSFIVKVVDINVNSKDHTI